MVFEYDRHKSEANKAEHGIDFDEAQALWQDPALIEIPARAMDAPRGLAVAKWAGHQRTAIFTRPSARIRLISVRCARDEDVKVYE